jgi:hypothetical protein
VSDNSEEDKLWMSSVRHKLIVSDKPSSEGVSGLRSARPWDLALDSSEPQKVK